MEPDLRNKGEILQGKGRAVRWALVEIQKLHKFVMSNSVDMAPLLREYENEVARYNVHVALASCRPFEAFSSWLARRADEMRAATNPALSLSIMLLSLPPADVVIEYTAMWAYGNHYRILEDEDAPLPFMTFDSGVSSMILQGCRSSACDRNVVVAALKYVGIVKKIVMVRYGHMRYMVLKCSWIKPNMAGRHPPVRRDDHGFWLVDYKKLVSPGVEPFIFPLTVKQVFFVDDLANPGWRVVCRKESRSRRVFAEPNDATLDVLGLVDPITAGRNIQAPNVGVPREAPIHMPLIEVDALNDNLEPENYYSNEDYESKGDNSSDEDEEDEAPDQQHPMSDLHQRYSQWTRGKLVFIIYSSCSPSPLKNCRPFGI